jgi:hypothetical protein
MLTIRSLYGLLKARLYAMMGWNASESPEDSLRARPSGRKILLLLKPSVPPKPRGTVGLVSTSPAKTPTHRRSRLSPRRSNVPSFSISSRKRRSMSCGAETLLARGSVLAISTRVA